MKEVVIDGIRYVPEGAAVAPTGPRIGVGITTRNRWDIVTNTLAEVKRLTPGATIVVVNDAGDDPPAGDWGDVVFVRFNENRGIAVAKNECLEVLYDAGVEHFFLFDDDAYPLIEGWWKPYVESPEPHLMYVFQEFAGKGAPKLNDCVSVGTNGREQGWSTPRGVMLYAARVVLDTVGGMDPGFGLWGYEHGDWSNRIHAAGLTTYRYGDVVDSDRLIYSLDEHVHELGGHTRSVSAAERKANLAPNKQRHDRQYNSPIYYEFREPRDVVLAAYFSGAVDVQRKKAWAADPQAVQPLVDSLGPRGLVLFHNELEDAPGRVKVPPPEHPYFDRWRLFYQYLRDNPDVRWAWCVDSTDVVMLHEPMGLEPGTLYVGSEPSVTGIPWMLDNHPEYAEWLAAHSDEQLLNCGVVGGARVTVMNLCHAMMREYQDHRGAGRVLKIDMGAFNYVARRFKIVTGPRVHTVFRAKDHKNSHAWWAHK